MRSPLPFCPGLAFWQNDTLAAIISFCSFAREEAFANLERPVEIAQVLRTRTVMNVNKLLVI